MAEDKFSNLIEPDEEMERWLSLHTSQVNHQAGVL